MCVSLSLCLSPLPPCARARARARMHTHGLCGSGGLDTLQSLCIIGPHTLYMWCYSKAALLPLSHGCRLLLTCGHWPSEWLPGWPSPCHHHSFNTSLIHLDFNILLLFQSLEAWCSTWPPAAIFLVGVGDPPVGPYSREASTLPPVPTPDLNTETVSLKLLRPAEN